MAMSTLVGTKGQVTIEKSIREALGVRRGWGALQRLKGDRVIIDFLPPRHRQSLAGALEHATAVRLPTEPEFQATVERAWEETLRKEWNAPPCEEASGDERGDRSRVWCPEGRCPADGIDLRQP
jgi:bifunctional DNA-binding transcriptional regulator/antitoxin component of YhaV-PrlF toxin-antitoxin module